MLKKSSNLTNLIVYQSKSGSLELKTDVKYNTIWLNQDQLALLFDVQKAAISKHLKNIFTSKELKENAVVSKMETTAKDGKLYQVNHYNLDAAISVGYRINSKKATHFRQWATNILKHHIIDGYTINRSRIKTNYDAFLTAVTEVKKLLPTNTKIDNESVLELITMFADTWFSLDAYDKNKLIILGTTKKSVALTAIKLYKALFALKQNLILKGEASAIFGAEKDNGSVAGIIGNVMQSFGGQDLYQTIEEKAAHLLYFIIKNHPFVDGNKRCGAYAFIWFLQQAKVLDVSRITPPALTALTLLIAESDPKDKNRMIGVVCLVLKQQIVLEG